MVIPCNTSFAIQFLVGTCAYRGGRHGLRGPLKLHMIFGTSCILFAFASVTVLSTSYASMSAWENGPTALNDNFEVWHSSDTRI